MPGKKTEQPSTGSIRQAAAAVAMNTLKFLTESKGEESNQELVSLVQTGKGYLLPFGTSDYCTHSLFTNSCMRMSLPFSSHPVSLVQ